MRITALFLLILIGFWIPAKADWVIVQDVETRSPRIQQTSRITIKIKGNKTRIDSGPQTSSIRDNDSGDQIILMHLQKQYTVQSASQRKEGMEFVKKAMRTAGGDSEKRPELRTTGRKERISGYDTEQFVWEGSAQKGSYWVAKDFPNYAAVLKCMEDAFSNEVVESVKGSLPDMKNLLGMPIRTEQEQTTKAPPGLTPEQLRQMGLAQDETIKTAMTLVSVKEETLSDADFSVPLGYTERGASVQRKGSAEGLSEVLKAMEKQGLSEADRKRFEQMIKGAGAQQRKSDKDTTPPSPK